MRGFIISSHKHPQKELEAVANICNMLNITMVDNFGSSNIVFILGNGNLNPVFYGEEPVTNLDDVLNNYREDTIYTQFFRLSQVQGKMLIGFNRGALLLAALSGSNIISKVPGHAKDKSHWVWFKKFSNSKLIQSNHEQLMYPFNLTSDKFEVIAHNVAPTYIGYYENGEKFKMDINQSEPEVVYFPKTKALCIQPDIFEIENLEKSEVLKVILKTIKSVIDVNN